MKKDVCPKCKTILVCDSKTKPHCPFCRFICRRQGTSMLKIHHEKRGYDLNK